LSEAEGRNEEKDDAEDDNPGFIFHLYFSFTIPKLNAG
jgi:hypothetical protein